MQFKHSGMGLLLAAVCLTSGCSKSDAKNLIGRWQTTAGPNMIFKEDGTVYSINRGPRRKGRYYLNLEEKPHSLIMDMRKSTINAVLYFDYEAFSPTHIKLTPTYIRRTGEKKKEPDTKRKMLFRKVDANDPRMGENQAKIEATPSNR